MRAIRDRVIELRKVPAAELAANPANWRTHDERQRTVFRAILDEIGFAGSSLAYYSERAGGLLTLIDGHLRQEEVGPDFAMACAITDLTDAEADKLIAAFDPVSGMAGADPAKLDELLARVQTESEALHGLLKSLAENAGLYAAEWSGVAPESINELDPYDPTSETVLLKIADVLASDRDAVVALVNQALEAHGGGYVCKAF